MPAAQTASKTARRYGDLQNEAAASWSPGDRTKAGQEMCRREGGRERNVSPNSMFENKQLFSPKPSVRLSTCAWKRKGRDRERERERKVNYWKKQVSLWEFVRAAKRLSTSLLVLAAACLWIWPWSGFPRPYFWKMQKGFNLKRGP